MKRNVLNLKTARRLLAQANSQVDSASTSSWEPAEPGQCVTMAFYSFENAVVAAAEAVGYHWEKNHPSKVKVAELLARNGKVKADVSRRLVELNRLRKDVSYGEPGMELANMDLEDLVSDLYEFISEVESLVSSVEDETGQHE